MAFGCSEQTRMREHCDLAWWQRVFLIGEVLSLLQKVKLWDGGEERSTRLWLHHER